MKTVVSLQDLVDFEIHPGALLEEFHALTRTSVAALVSGPLVDVPCPACAGTDSSAAFTKLGLSYRLCGTCASVFVSPRPKASALAEYAQSSPAAAFWRDRILGETRAARLDKLIRPRAEWVLDALTEHRPGARAGIDLSGQGPAFLKELASQSPALGSLTSADPHAAPWSVSGLDFVAAFDVLDRASDVAALVAAVHDALGPGGLFFVTAPSVSGFDLQVLWERSPTMTPPDKLNVLSVEGFSQLFRAPDWSLIELSTPGMFDVENVRRAMLAAPEADWPRGVREIVLQRDEGARLEFQEYLQRHRLASFARLVVRRRL
jgi:SAM-dependent methyltransferase